MQNDVMIYGLGGIYPVTPAINIGKRGLWALEHAREAALLWEPRASRSFDWVFRFTDSDSAGTSPAWRVWPKTHLVLVSSSV